MASLTLPKLMLPSMVSLLILNSVLFHSISAVHIALLALWRMPSTIPLQERGMCYSLVLEISSPIYLHGLQPRLILISSQMSPH